MKKALSVLLVVVILLSVVVLGCTTEATKESAEEVTVSVEESAEEVTVPVEESSEEVKLTWAVVPYQPHFVEIPEKIAQMYMEKHPNVKVIVNSIPNEEYFTKLPTLVAGGQVPDIMFNHSGNEEVFAKAGVTMDLTPFLTSGDRDKYPIQAEDFDKTFLEIMTTMSGEIHAIPMALDVYVMYYNKRMFDDAGLDYPTNDWSYDDLKEMSIAMTKTLDDGTKQYGFVWDPVQSHNAIQGPGAAGFNVTTLDENDEYNFNTPIAKKGWEYYFNGLSEGWSMPVDEIEDIGGYSNAFMLSKAAMVPAARWGAATFREMKDDWDVVIMPKGESGKHFANCGAFGYSVSATTKYPDVAIDFLCFAYSEEAYALWTANYSTVPALLTLADSEIWRGLPGPPYNNDAYIDALDDAGYYPQVPWFREETMNQLYREMVDRFVAGHDLQTILDDAVEAMNADIAARKAEYFQ